MMTFYFWLLYNISHQWFNKLLMQLVHTWIISCWFVEQVFMTWQVGGAGGGVAGFIGWNQAGGELCLWWGWSDNCLDNFLPSLFIPRTPVEGDIGAGDKARVGDIGLRASGGSGGFILTSCGTSRPSMELPELDLMVLSSIFCWQFLVRHFIFVKAPIDDNHLCSAALY